LKRKEKRKEKQWQALKINKQEVKQKTVQKENCKKTYLSI